jgi:drug/metabolite transporter (DMT)-like permease
MPMAACCSQLMTAANVLLSALLHALWNALLRLEKDKDRTLVAAVAVATVLAIVVGGIRWALGTVPFETTESVIWTVGAGVLEWIYFASLAKALDRGPLGAVYTISRGGAILVVWPVSIALFAEPLTLTSGIGSAVVLGGLALAGIGAGSTRQTRVAALAWAVFCAISIAGYHLAYKGAMAAGGSASAVFAVALAVASSINVARLGREGRRIARDLVRARPGRVIFMGLICGGSFLILMEALHGGGAGYVLTLRNTSVLFATVFAAVIGERPRRTEVLGSLLVAAGAVLMAWH